MLLLLVPARLLLLVVVAVVVVVVSGGRDLVNGGFRARQMHAGASSRHATLNAVYHNYNRLPK